MFQSRCGMLVSIGTGPAVHLGVGIPKLHSITGKQQPIVFLYVQQFKKGAELVSRKLRSKEIEQPGQQRNKTDKKRQAN